jgi:O-antigen ligase
MTTDQRHGACATPEAQTTQSQREWILAAVLFGLLLVEGIREGGFWPSDSLFVAIVSIVVLVVGMVLVPPDRRSMLLVGSVVLLALWWLVRALTAETIRSFLPLGASMLAFPAAFVAVRPLVGRARDVAALAVACLGATGALVGFAGLVWRWYPMAIPTQALWRISSTLTYSDAAGLVLGVCLLVALGVNLCPPLVRVTVCLCAGGLLATQSRGAYLAVVCACLLVPWRRYVRFAVPLIAGIALGVAAIASSPDTSAVPWLAVVVVAAAAVSASPWRDDGRWWDWWDSRAFRATRDSRVVLAVIAVGLVVAAVAAVAAVAVLHHEIGVRALAPSDQDRSSEWSAALHQWRSEPLWGVGPDRLLTFRAADGTYAHFAHNEYLQVAADAGAVGLALLVLTGFATTRVARRSDVLSSCATSALVCWAVAGAFDFDWHLPFVGLLGGVCVGLAARRDALT